MNNQIQIPDFWKMLSESNNEVVLDTDPMFLVSDYEVFTIANIEFIKFPSREGRTPILSKNLLFDSVFGHSNNLSESDELLARMNREVLTKVTEVVGEDNVLEFETDLISLDGLKDYGSFRSKISLPTVDFIRQNAEILDRYNPGSAYYTASPFSTPRHGYSRFVCYVHSVGALFGCVCGCSLGVRPFLILDSLLFGS